ncbi:MAG: hypothetical protein IMF26_04615 [Candidatus Fermentithermobacillus carboniphilus]|uniref:Uncharacterized protein n=1 Tax=Candidatus Fermentithermobacillus carboniphilus TaxID=3085328 RepID=A0AAT9LDH7_9FIRM|nr:MAG: hypothetical protein IMF26_04615 [Candidatus Fermentithermobacillus carboniphilus]
MEDFHCIFKVIRDNCPFHWVKARTGGLDWTANEKEFERWVSETIRAGTFGGYGRL